MRAGFLKLEQTALKYPNQNPCRGEKLRPLADPQRLPLVNQVTFWAFAWSILYCLGRHDPDDPSSAM